MSCVPIIIPTLCRYEHFKRCIESLQKNKLAEETELFIGLDYPAKESHWEGYLKIKEYLDEGISGFLDVHVIKHDKNVGNKNNTLGLCEMVYERFDCYIYSEDDNEFAPSYLQYMNYYMKEYENDEEVLAIAGYSYPFEKEGMDGDIYVLNTYFSALGYGIWKYKQDKMLDKINLENFEHKLMDSRIMKKLRKASFNQFGNFVKGMVEYTPDLVQGNIVRTCDLARGLYMFFENKKMVYPKISMVRNWGYDGSGVNCESMVVEENKKICHRNFDFMMQELDERIVWNVMPVKSSMDDQEINKRLQDFFCISTGEKIRTLAAYYMIRLIGRKRMAAFIKRKNIV